VIVRLDRAGVRFWNCGLASAAAPNTAATSEAIHLHCSYELVQKAGMVVGSLNAQRDFANASLVYLNKLSAESGNDTNTLLDLAIGYFWVAQIQATRGRMSLGRWRNPWKPTGRPGDRRKTVRFECSDPLHNA